MILTETRYVKTTINYLRVTRFQLFRAQNVCSFFETSAEISLLITYVIYLNLFLSLLRFI